MYKKVFSLFIAFVAAGNCYAQTKMPQVVPPAPNSANLGEYINTPIGHYTGIPKITVPIYNIKVGDFTLPINLNYTSGGVKVASQASSCGLSWTLDAGGAITRSVVGLPDETPFTGYLAAQIPTEYAEHNPSTYNDWLDFAEGRKDGQQDLFYFSLPGSSGRYVFNKDGSTQTIPRQNLKITVDRLENLSFADLNSGLADCISQWKVVDEKGIIYRFNDYEKTASAGRVVKISSGTDTWLGTTLNVSSWYLTEIELLNGEKIYFTYDVVPLSYDLPPSTNYHVAGDELQANFPTEFDSSPTVQRLSVRSKRLTSITFPNGKIRFTASSLGRADLIGDNALDKIIIENGAGEIIKQFALNYQYLIGANLVDYNSVSPAGDSNHFYSASTTPHNSFKRRLMLKSVVEQDKNGVPLNQGTSFDYHHEYGLPNRASVFTDHWGYANNLDDIMQPEPSFEPFVVNNIGQFYITGKSPAFNYGKQGSLYRVTYPTGGYSEYEYEQNDAEKTSNLPPKIIKTSGGTTLSFSHAAYNILNYDLPYEVRVDERGYTTNHHYSEFNVTAANNSNVQVIIQNMPAYINIPTFAFYIENTANPNHKIWEGTHSDTYYLNLPPGSYRLYHRPEIELLSSSSTDPRRTALYSAGVTGIYQFTEVNESGNSVDVGGIRVKKIKTFDPVTSKAINHAYTYVKDGKSSGELLAVPLYKYRARAAWAAGVLLFSDYTVLSTASVYPLSTTHGSYVGYNFVTEQKTTDNGIPLGKTEYSFSAPMWEPDVWFTYPGSVFPNPPVDNRDWLRGALKQQVDYEYKNSNFFKVRKVSNIYDQFFTMLSQGVQTNIYTKFLGDVAHTPVPTTGFHSFAAIRYNFTTGYTYPKKTEETLYANADSTTKTTTFEHSLTSLLPVRETLLNSDGSKKHVFSTYPLEYAAGTPFIDSLVYKNNVNVPIEKVTVKEYANGDKVVLSGNISKYQANHKGLKDAEMVFEHPAPLPLNSFNFSNRSAGVLPNTGTPIGFSADAKYKQRLKYQSYDDKGNLVSAKLEDGSSICYIWSYNQQYPVAEIKNADYATVVAALGGASAVDSFAVSTPANKAAIESFLAPVRNHITTLKDAHVTSYSYEYLVGMKSSTDAKGQSASFDYDGFQRLKYIKDQNGNIIKANEYHYKP